MDNRLAQLEREREEILAILLRDPSDDTAYYDLQDIDNEILDESYPYENILDEELDEKALDRMVDAEIDSKGE